MGLSLWLGLFVVTRSPRSRISWLSSLALWSVTLYFGANVIYLHSATQAASALALKVLNLGASVLPAAWLHLSALLLPARAHRRMKIPVVTAYLLVLAFILLGTLTDSVIFPVETIPRAYSSGKGAGVLYPLFILFIMGTAVFAFSMFYRLWRHERRSHLKPQVAILTTATALVIPGGLYLTLGTWLALNLPTLPGDMVLAVGVLLLGYGVSKWNALVEGRVIELDFRYTFLMIAMVASIYFLSTGFFFGPQGLSLVNAVMVVALAIVSHFTYDWARTFLDRFFYQRQFQELRANLRNFAREAGTGRSLERHLALILRSLCRSFSTSSGFIALKEGEGVEVGLSPASTLLVRDHDWTALSASAAKVLSSAERKGDLADMVVLVPLRVRGEQIGALALGDRVAGAFYTCEDLELLEDLADQMAAVISTIRLQENNLRQIDHLVRDYRQREREVQLGVQALLAPEHEIEFPVPGGLERGEFVELVEEALRRCHDLTYLGEHPLARLRAVERSLTKEEGTITHLDRGRALRDLLMAAIDKLKPDQEEPKHPSREWYPHIIVHDAYVVGIPNREIMSRLYISEGTFNRTRRRAILAVARALGEMGKET